MAPEREAQSPPLSITTMQLSSLSETKKLFAMISE